MMPRAKLLLVIGLFLFIGSCFPKGSAYHGSGPRMPLVKEGEVIIYLEALPQESNRLRFIIEGISARHDDGLEIPLTLAFREIKGADHTGHQKLLASGILPPGSYSGISIQIQKAWVQTEDGEMGLFVPEKAYIVDHAFNVTRREISAQFLTLNPSGMITAGIRFSPVFSLASAGRTLINLIGFVSNPASNRISVFNKKTMRIVNAIATDAGPSGLVLDQLRTRAYVAAAKGDIVAVIDVFNMKIINRLDLDFKDHPVWLALTRDGRTLVSVNRGTNTVSIIDALSMIEIERVEVGQKPSSAVMDPNGLKVYVMNTRSNSVSVVDLTQRRQAATIAVEGGPLRGAFNREGNKLYIIGRDWPYITVIDRSRLVIDQKIFIGTGAVSIRIDDKTGLIYVGKKLGAEISVIEPFSGQLVDHLQAGGRSVFMTIDGQERTLLAAVADRSVLQKFSLTSKELMAEIEMGEGAFAVVVMGER